ncbi:MAG: 23S rRNA (uracil1939-C5)-methyltransferase [Cellvibrionaceae bacterium]|jgi:23S rRNA (uracil1939-C5)-methyltransferase
MVQFKLKLTAMAHGGQALGRDKRNQVIFVPGGIPGEMVEIETEKIEGKKKYFSARLVRVVKASPNRRPFSGSTLGPHGGLAYAHIKYKAQLEYKRMVAADQLKRLGGLKVKIDPFVRSPEEWGYDHDVILSPTPVGGFGLWNPRVSEVVPPEEAIRTLIPALQDLMNDLDFELPDLRRLTLRASTKGGDQLVALEVSDIEPPEITVDFPVSAAIVLPNRTAANLIGDSFVVREVNDHLYRISAGVEFSGNPPVAGLLANRVMELAALQGSEIVLDLYSGPGLLTRHLAEQAAEVHGVERNGDAIGDAAINLAETENVSLYEGLVEEVLALIDVKPDLIVLDPPATGLSQDAFTEIMKLKAKRLIYVSSDVATLARDGKLLSKAGYKPEKVSGFDMYPQTFHMSLVSSWSRK